MEDKSVNNTGKYISLLIGVAFLIYAIYSLVIGYSNGFNFHIWNLQLKGFEAVVINITYLVACLMWVFSEVWSIKHGSK